MFARINRLLLLGAAAAALTACGGDGVDTASNHPLPHPTPAPTPSPTPAPTTTPADVPAGAVTAFAIVDNPPDGKLVVAGVSTTGAIGDLSTASSAPADQPEIRYQAATNTYQLKFPDRSWSTLWVAADAMHPDTLAIGNTGAVLGLNIYPRPGSGDAYSYSRLAWYSEIGDHYGSVAFGVPTGAEAVPTTGSARYDGVISGETDIVYIDENDPWGWPDARGVNGTVTLSFNFADGTLGGSMEPMLGTSESLGVFTFKDGVYSAGSYSGRFDTSVAGINAFNGQLTGPHGEELIGGWALPFHYAGDNQDHQAVGAWVAKH
jgi:hypothetical protein